jgi:hypothetical protein
MYWFIPSHSGDYRLEAVGKGLTSCKLTVIKPTTFEYNKVLKPFLAKLHELEMLPTDKGIAEKGTTVLKIQKPLAQVGGLLANAVAEAHGETWTAIRSVGGKITLLADSDDPVKIIEASDDTLAVVTVKKPRRGCPAPEDASIRASQVLRTFSTMSQWADFLATGSMKLIGSASGRAYRVFHRKRAVERSLGHLLIDDTGDEVCVWDDSIPAEEEMLAIKFAIEHRESWLMGGHLGGGLMAG